MKGYVYGCVERENGFLHDGDFVDRHEYVLTKERAVTLWKHLCNNIIDYCKELGEVTVVIEDHTYHGDTTTRIIDCCFYVNGEYIGYATLSLETTSND